ncbi:MAG: D-cysteine desulfhydrase family protein [Candidatus Heimdallarchaeota archaeon]|nr:D-cysteine desulfhydrase family protein [Candidatus Heimdallarchaeota archaeon]
MLNFDLKSIPRIEHCLLPTPLVQMERLTEYLGKAKIYVKRDDLTGIAFGGNKNRKLEFLLADALLKGSDVIITEGAITSNHCLQTAACATRLGLDCELVLSDSHIGDGFTGNLLLDQILDAKIHRVKTSADRKLVMENLAENLKNDGKQPYIIPTGGSNKIGVLGYVLCIQEIAQQSSNMNAIFDYFVHPTGSAGTQAGILIGKKLYYPEMEVIGIGVGDSKEEIIHKIRKIISDFEQEWKNDLSINNSEIIVKDSYSGDGYGIPNKEMIDTIKLVAKLEGIFLDPVYNGKAMVGLIDLVESEEIPVDSSVLFLHSGGGPAIFAYSDVFGKKI